MLKSILFSLAIALLGLAPASAMAAGTGGGSSEPDEVQQSRSLLKDGNYAKAEGLLRKAVVDDPQNADAWNLLGYATRLQGDHEQAEEFYGKALALDDDHVGALEYLGMLYVQTGRIDEAKKLLARIDDACLFTCDEFESLERAIETGKVEKASGW